MAESSQQLALYGPADAKGTNRFQVIGDGRRMYPIFIAGSMYDQSWDPTKIRRGGSRLFSNLMVRGDQVYALGGTFSDVPNTPTTLSLRLGTALNTGNNALTSGDFLLYGFPYAVRRLDAGIHSGLMVNGEAFFRDTQPTVPQLGCSSENFTIAGTVSQVTLGGTTVLGNGTAFTTAALSFGYGYTPSLNLPRAGDIIRINQGGNNYFHRITAITDATHLDIYPKWGKQLDNTTNNGATSAGPGAGLTYALYRTGFGSYSRIVSIYRDAASPNDIFYNYYVGNHFSRALPGTIECFTREASGGAASTHYMCPQDSGAADIKAQDIAYYKSYLLYGYGTAVGWSKAGFPNTFPFDTADFPAGNKTVVDNTDQFISFEMLGDQLLAIFRNSIWEIQATGTVPEFNFYRLPEPVGAYLAAVPDPYGSAGIMHYRPTCTGRNSIFYVSRAGVLELSGRTSSKISENIHSIFSAAYISSINTPGGISWDHSTDSVLLSRNSGVNGHAYRRAEAAWSEISLSGTGRFLGPILESGAGLDLAIYKDSVERLQLLDPGTGAPFNVAPGGSLQWTYLSPVVSMSDDYGSYIFAGFQLDGKYSTGISYGIYGANNPFDASALSFQRDSGTIGDSSTSSNRKLYGKKIDDPFICILLIGTVPAVLSTINIYTLGVGV